MLTWFLTTIWPFIREIWVGESDLSKAIRRNKLTTLLFVINIASLCLVFYMTDQVITQQEDRVNLKTKITEQDKLIQQLKEQSGNNCMAVKISNPDILLVNNIADLREYIEVLKTACKKDH